MNWIPAPETAMAVDFWLKCLQAVMIIAGVPIAVANFIYHSKQQREAVRRELQRPYQERKLNLYLDAARVLAHLAA